MSPGAGSMPSGAGPTHGCSTPFGTGPIHPERSNQQGYRHSESVYYRIQWAGEHTPRRIKEDTMAKQETAVQFRPGAEMRAWIANQAKVRGKTQSAGLAANDSLMLLRALLTAELARQRWSLDDLAVITQATREVRPNIAVDPNLPGQVWGALHTYCDTTDPAVVAVMDRLDRLGPVGDKALLHAVTEHRDRKLDDDAEGWSEVGITVG